MEKMTPIQAFTKKIKVNYVLMMDRNGYLQPFCKSQKKLLSWDYLHTVSLLDTDFESFRSYIKKSLPACASIIFAPKRETIVKFNETNYLNTYKEYKVTHSEHGDCSLFHELMQRMFPIASERKTVTQWIAHAIQKPEERPTWGIMLTGKSGTGKGTLFNSVLTPLCSKQTTSVSRFSALTEKFSEVLDGNVFLALDDCKFGTVDTQTRLKSLLSEPSVYIEPKGLTAGMVDTYTRIILNSNDKLPLPIDDNDRRWFACQFMDYAVSKDETVNFTKNTFKGWIASKENKDAVYHYLNTLDLTDFDPFQCEQTPTLLSMMEQSTPSLELVIQDYIDNGNQLFKRDDLTEHLNRRRLYPTEAILTETLTKLRYTKDRVLGNTHTVYFPMSYNKKNITQWPMPVSF